MTMDTEAVRELELFIVSDAELYRQQTVPIQNNLRRKWTKGIYDPTKAAKLWRYLVDNGAKKYARQYSTGVHDARVIFPGPVRNEVARSLEVTWREELEREA